MTCSALVSFHAGNKTRPGRAFIWMDVHFGVRLPPACATFCAKYPQFVILWRQECIKALCTPGSLRRLQHKPLISRVSGKSSTCVVQSNKLRSKTLSPHITCLLSLNINTCLEMSHNDVRGKKAFCFASGRYDQSAVYAPQRGKQDGAEDQSELTLWFMKAELLMLTGFLKIRVVVNIHVKRETVIK